MIKAIILLVALVFSLEVFSGSYFIKSNGRVISIADNGLAQNFNGAFIFPQNISLSAQSFYLDRIGRINIIKSNGEVYSTTLPYHYKNVKEYGGSWLISSGFTFMTVTNQGELFTYQDETFKNDDIIAKGNHYFITKNLTDYQIVTINKNSGTYNRFSAQQLGFDTLDLSSIEQFGGNYFIDNNGVLYTIDQNGLIYQKKNLGFFQQKYQLGGSYFIDQSENIFVVLSNGYLLKTKAPISFQVSRLAENYFITRKGEILTIATSVSEKEIKSATPDEFSQILTKLVSPINIQVKAYQIRVITD